MIDFLSRISNSNSYKSVDMASRALFVDMCSIAAELNDSIISMSVRRAMNVSKTSKNRAARMLKSLHESGLIIDITPNGGGAKVWHIPMLKDLTGGSPAANHAASAMSFRSEDTYSKQNSPSPWADRAQ